LQKRALAPPHPGDVDHGEINRAPLHVIE
jgi:hypothetical protein